MNVDDEKKCLSAMEMEVDDEEKMARYTKGEKIGHGTSSSVFKGTDTKTNQTVAIKVYRPGAEMTGLDPMALREIKHLLYTLKHTNVVDMTDCFFYKKQFHLIFEFMESHLQEVIYDYCLIFSPWNIKSYMKMLLEGLAYCHRNGVVHRDIKPGTLLIGADGQLKLSDFGLARRWTEGDQDLTNEVFALWYRAPELLLGAKNYTPAVDIWAAGCVFAELHLRLPFLQGSSEINQMTKIKSAFGTPTPAQWPDLLSLPGYVESYSIFNVPAKPLTRLFPTAIEDARDLLGRMFTYNPSQRISAEEALAHPYFLLGPRPTNPPDLPKSLRRLRPRFNNNSAGTERKGKSILEEEEQVME